jgi:acetylornithine/N-succinyldiaminopimelate aminotransferase
MDFTERLQASTIENDPRITTAKQLLLEVIAEKQSHITEIKPKNSKLNQSYQEVLDHFTEYRGHSLWFPYLGSGLGNGALVELLDRKSVV